MLDKDHHIHLIPAERVLMMSLEHSTIKKVEDERYEVECYLKLSVEGFPHPLEDVIRFTFAASKIPGQQMMTELTFVQNHIISTSLTRDFPGSYAVVHRMIRFQGNAGSRFHLRSRLRCLHQGSSKKFSHVMGHSPIPSLS